MLDLDHFKALNDSLGHAGGDAALREFASIIRQRLRGIDVLARWGGEEFVAILPETDLAGAVVAAEDMRATLAGQAVSVGGGIHLTCSLGVASFPQHGETRDLLLEVADRAMYTAKRLGRNQIRAAGDRAIDEVDDVTHRSGSRGDTALLGTVEALAALVDARDHYTGDHSQKVAALGARLASALALDATQIHLVILTGRLHDVGKVAIPDAVLQKPGRLTQDEWTIMRRHPAIGADVVSRVPALRVLAPAIRGHQEWWNGQGYPDGLRGIQIPQVARIVSVADAYGAMTNDRPYRQKCSPSAALKEIRRCAGTQFDPEVVAALERISRVEGTAEDLDAAV